MSLYDLQMRKLRKKVVQIYLKLEEIGNDDICVILAIIKKEYNKHL
mgnify:CR=1 FL=1